MYNLHLTTHTIISCKSLHRGQWEQTGHLQFLTTEHFSFLTLILCTLLLRFALHSQFLSEFPSNTWDKEKFKVFDIWTQRPLNPHSPQVWPFCKKSCSLSETQISNSDDNPIPKAFRRISNWFLPSPHQFPWSAHLAVIIVTYNGDIKLKLSHCFRNYLRAVLGTKAAPKSLLPNCMFFFLRRWSFFPLCPREKKKNTAASDNRQ